MAVFTVVCSLGFVAGTLLFLPNRIPLYASLPVLLFLLGYSYAKRFTAWSHVWLGAALMLAPLAAWVAIRGGNRLAAGLPGRGRPVVGCRLRYDLCVPGRAVRRADAAAQRAEPFRRGGGLAAGRRVPPRHDRATGRFAVGLPGFGRVYLAGVAAMAALLVYEHWLVRPDDLSRVNRAFFQVNAVVSIGLLAIGTIDLILL